MSDVATLEQPIEQQTQQQEPIVQASPSANEIMAKSLWDMEQTPYQNVEPIAQPEPAAVTEPAQVIPPAADAEEIFDENDYVKRLSGLDLNEFKAKWEEFNNPKEATAAQEIKWNYDDSKEDEIYTYIHQKRELDKLEKMDVADANQAAEILHANLQFKYKDTLTSQEIDRIFSKQYSMPVKPAIDADDIDYADTIAAWESQVKEKQLDMIIEAKMAKPELSKFKSQIVQPDIIQKQQVQQGPTQEELAAIEAGRKAYVSAVESNYQNFKGYSVTAKDGDVQLPISYMVSPDEVSATKQTVENFNVNDFFGSRWFDEKGNPNVNLMQEDLYHLSNRDKIHQKIANEAAAKMKDHMIKIQNNINLKGVNPTLGPTSPNQPAPKNESQALAENIWKL